MSVGQCHEEERRKGLPVEHGFKSGRREMNLRASLWMPGIQRPFGFRHTSTAWKKRQNN